jgi:hypothetical protein
VSTTTWGLRRLLLRLLRRLLLPLAARREGRGPRPGRDLGGRAQDRDRGRGRERGGGLSVFERFGALSTGWINLHSVPDARLDPVFLFWYFSHDMYLVGWPVRGCFCLMAEPGCCRWCTQPCLTALHFIRVALFCYIFVMIPGIHRWVNGPWIPLLEANDYFDLPHAT